MKNTITKSFLISTAVIALTGCGPQAYKRAELATQQQAAGNFMIQPKVDILLAEDDTGSMNEVFSQISGQMPALLANLSARGWDYHFAVTPLTTRRAIQEILASKQDGNWGSEWLPPFPGAIINAEGTIASSFFRKPGEFTEFLTRSDVTNNLNGKEPGLDNIVDALKNRLAGTGFLRSDAMLMVIAVSNGEDTSGVTFCTRQDGIIAPCEDIGVTEYGTKASSFEHYKQELKNLKSNPSQIKFYAAVSPTATSSTCLGQRAYAGTRYRNMATTLGGAAYDVCNESLSSILGGMATHLQATKLAFRTRYVMINAEPDTSTIKVVRYINGDINQAVEIPQDEENGWTYAGAVSDVYTIDYPIAMNQASGYAIELHGTARLMGDDTADVTFNAAGSKDSISTR